MPFGLSGTTVLPESSCESCAEITGGIERDLLRGSMQPVRIYRELKSRKKHRDAPSTYPISLVINGKEQTVELPIHEYPILLHFPVFFPPACLAPEGYTTGIRVRGIVTINYGAKPDDTLQKFGATQIRHTANCQAPEFARMIAKIGYSMAVAEGQLDFISGEPYVLPSILGQRDDIGRWVGTITQPFQAHVDQLHRIFIHKDLEQGLLIAEVQLFSDSPTPSYGIVLGQLKVQKIV